MLNIRSVCEKIQTTTDAKCECVYDINLVYNGYQRQKYNIPAAMVLNSAVVVFVHFFATSDKGSETLKIGFQNVLRALSEKLDLSINSFMLLGVVENTSEDSLMLCSFNIYNDRITYFSSDNDFEDFVSVVADELTYRHSVFEDALLSDLAFNLNLLGGSNGEVRKDSEGNYYLKKHGEWRLASDCDPDEMFQKAVFFGAFGAHKFSEQKNRAGIFYLLSCGFFGVGWLFDCLSIVCGFYKDADGKYLLPVSNRKSCFLKMLGGLVVTVGYMALYIVILSLIGDLFNSIVTGSVDANKDTLADFTGE